MPSASAGPDVPAPASPDAAAAFDAILVAPRFAHDPSWPWLTTTSPLSRGRFERHYVDNTCRAVPKATVLYRRWQHRRAARLLRRHELGFLFSTDINVGVAEALGRGSAPPRIYVGFTQDGHWSGARIARLGRALRGCAAVTVFTEQERSIYVERYGLDPDRVHVVPIHTDDPEGHRDLPAPPREPGSYVLTMGLMNRRFGPTARACRALDVPLVVLTRPHHANDDLDELRGMGATVVTDADQPTAWGWLRGARFAVNQYTVDDLPAGFTTIMNAMLLGTPYVTTRSIGVDEHVVSGETGFVVDHDDETALGAAIARLWSDEGLCTSMADAARARAATRHGLVPAAERYFGLALSVLADAR